MDKLVLELKDRQLVGKKVERLRRDGITPVHMYGPGVDSRSLQVPTQDLLAVLQTVGSTIPISIVIDGGEEHLTFVREVQWEPVSGELLHVDLLRAELTRLMTVAVPLTLVGESPAAKESGGALVQYLYSVDIEALPLDIPASLELDVSSIADLETVLRASDIPLPPKSSMVTSSSEPVARVIVAVEEVVEEQEELAPEEADAAESEAVSESDEADPTEA